MTINVSNQPPTVQSASYTLPAVATTIAADSGVLATATDPFGVSLDGGRGLRARATARSRSTATAASPTPRRAAAPYSDSFTFHASDGVNPSATATVTLNIEDTPPSPGPIESDGSTYTYAVQPGGSTSWTAAAGVLSRASDPYGYSLTAVPDASNSANGTLTTTVTARSFTPQATAR